MVEEYPRVLLYQNNTNIPAHQWREKEKSVGSFMEEVLQVCVREREIERQKTGPNGEALSFLAG